MKNNPNRYGGGSKMIVETQAKEQNNPLLI